MLVEAPERIWVTGSFSQGQYAHGSWNASNRYNPKADYGGVEYVRADKLEELAAENERLRIKKQHWTVRAEKAEPAPAADAPLGAVENGRVFLQRLVDHYDFQCEAGGLANCSDYHEAVRCFEAMAEWIYHGQIADRDFWKEQFQIETRVRIELQDALSGIANAYTAHGYSDAMDAVQNLKDIAKEALNAVR